MNVGAFFMTFFCFVYYFIHIINCKPFLYISYTVVDRYSY